MRPFQQQPPHISFQDPFPLKTSEHSLGTTSHVGRVGSALGMVNPCINSPTDCHSSQTSHSNIGVGKSISRILNVLSYFYNITQLLNQQYLFILQYDLRSLFKHWKPNLKYCGIIYFRIIVGASSTTTSSN